MSEYADVVIIGGAVMGSAAAYFLSERDDFSGRIIVLEKDASYADAASSRSTSGFRMQFSTPANIELAKYSSAFIRAANKTLALPDMDPGIPVSEAGYLYLGGAEQVAAFTENNALQRALGVDAVLLEPAELAQRFPWLGLEDVAIGSLGLSGEGWTDGHLLMNGFRRKARHNGVEYRTQEVRDLRQRDDGGFDVRLADGSALIAGKVINTAGLGAPAVAKMLGLEVPVGPVKQSVFVFDSPFRPESMPYLFTPDGLFCRPEGAGYIAGISIETHEGDAPPDLEVDYATFEDELWPRLAFRARGFEEVRLRSAWAGHYDMSLFDHNPFIGKVDGVPNFFIASGFSGHGLMQSPGVGRALSELIACGAYQTLDLSPLGFDRLARNAPVFERIQY